MIPSRPCRTGPSRPPRHAQEVPTARARRSEPARRPCGATVRAEPHISRTGQEDAKDDLWLAIDKLATDKEYLPIKIRKTEKDGSVIEQIVTRINTDISP